MRLQHVISLLLCAQQKNVVDTVKIDYAGFSESVTIVEVHGHLNSIVYLFVSCQELCVTF